MLSHVQGRVQSNNIFRFMVINKIFELLWCLCCCVYCFGVSALEAEIKYNVFNLCINFYQMWIGLFTAKWQNFWNSEILIQREFDKMHLEKDVLSCPSECHTYELIWSMKVLWIRLTWHCILCVSKGCCGRLIQIHNDIISFYLSDLH